MFNLGVPAVVILVVIVWTNLRNLEVALGEFFAERHSVKLLCGYNLDIELIESPIVFFRDSRSSSHDFRPLRNWLDKGRKGLCMLEEKFC